MKFSEKFVGLHVACKGEVFRVRHPNGAKFRFCDKCQLSTLKGATIEIEEINVIRA